MAKGGEIFVLDMGSPIKIADLARRMIHLSGFTVSDADEPVSYGIKIDFIGLRAGEKLHEELFIGDQVQPTRHPKIMVAAEPCLARGELDEFLAKLQRACAENDSTAVVEVLGGKAMWSMR